MDDYDIDYYVEEVGELVDRKLFIYEEMRPKIAEFKRSLREEEETHRKTF